MATRRGFTLVELMVVIAVIALLAGIVLPALSEAQRQAKALVAAANQRQIVLAATGYSTDSNDRYPESVATLGRKGKNSGWTQPMQLIGFRNHSPRHYRAMSGYLGSYIEGASTLVCPNAPGEFTYLQQAWDAGDSWSSPESPPAPDSLAGTLSFYWNYIGYLGEDRAFYGPRRSDQKRGTSKLLVSDYFGFGHERNPGRFSSCEKLSGAQEVPEKTLDSSWWASDRFSEFRLNAGYTDGHVESYGSSEVVPLRVSADSTGSEPYPDGVGTGILYLPYNSLF